MIQHIIIKVVYNTLGFDHFCFDGQAGRPA